MPFKYCLSIALGVSWLPVRSASQEEALLRQMQSRQRALRLASMCSKFEGQLGNPGTFSSSGVEESLVHGCPAVGDGPREGVPGGVQYAEAAELSLVSDASDPAMEASGRGGLGVLGGEEDVTARLANLEKRKAAVSRSPPHATLTP